MRKLSIICFVVLALGVAPTALARQERGADVRPVRQLPSKEKRWALLVGVSDYEDANITDLSGARDAKSLKEALVRHAGFPESQVVLLTTGEPRERQPTRENIIKRLASLKGLVPRDGLFLFAFSGHGIESGGQAFLIPSAMNYDDDVDVLKETAVGVEFVRRQIKAMHVQQVLVLLDACRNDPTKSRADSANPLTPAFTKGFSFDVLNREVTAYATLYATSVGDRAYEYAEKGQGYFTWAVVEALKGAAANERGEVTLYQLKRYVEEVVPREVRASLRKVQQPFGFIEGYKAEDLIIAVRGESAVLPPAPPPPYSQRDKDWALVDKRSRVELQLFLTKYKDDFEATLSLRRLEESEPKAGETMAVKLNDKVEMAFVYCPPGSFKMGSGNDAHPVTISRGFWLGQTEVTNEQWSAVMYTGPGPTEAAKNLPVSSSWIGAQEFIKKLNERQNLYTYRLPTEAEWEYAARAGTTNDKVDNLDSVAWYYHNSGEKHLEGSFNQEKSWANRNREHSVKQKFPNNWGLYDMLGNVWEWVSSKYMPYPYNPNDGREAQSGEGTSRVKRGGSFLDSTWTLSPSHRVSISAAEHYANVGFRLVVSARK